jgi:hypothetical protein
VTLRGRRTCSWATSGGVCGQPQVHRSQKTLRSPVSSFHCLPLPGGGWEGGPRRAQLAARSQPDALTSVPGSRLPSGLWQVLPATVGPGESLGRGNPTGARAPAETPSGGTPDWRQTLEVEGTGMLRQLRPQRRGGKGPGDRNQPVRRKGFEGEVTLRRRVGRQQRCWTTTVGSKPSEPHDRLQGATNLRSRVRRKPLKSGRTTRAEHVQGVATLGLGQPRVDAHGDVGGGAVFEELQERSPRRPCTSVHDWTRAAGGPDTFEEEVAGPW